MFSIVYDDEPITDRVVLELFYNVIKNYDSIKITNENLGGDPKPGMVPKLKEFVIEYKNLEKLPRACTSSRKR